MPPLVSVLTPTRDRREFLPQLLKYFRWQDYPPELLELVVVDDGRDKVGDLFRGDPRIRYEALDSRIPLGSKRNRLVELARGEILVHMDDDDYHPRDRVQRAVDTLATTEADVVGKSALTFWDLEKGTLHEVPAIGPKHACAGTMSFRRTYWEKHRFASDPHSEERQFLANFAANLAQFPCPSWEVMVCISHGGNTLPKNTSLPKLSLDLATLIPDAEDRAFYQNLDLDDW